MDDDIQITRLVVGQLSANCYIVGSAASGEGLLIDPGGNAQDIIQAIDSSGFIIRTILLTHGHSDHIAALYETQVHTGASVAIHRLDREFLIGQGPVSSQFGISYRTPAPPDTLLDDGADILLGNNVFNVIHTPGHTPGSICLLGGKRVFTGDTLMRRGIGTTLMPGSSRQQLLNSIRTKLLTLPDDTLVLPGHGRETTIGEERRHNRYLV